MAEGGEGPKINPDDKPHEAKDRVESSVSSTIIRGNVDRLAKNVIKEINKMRKMNRGLSGRLYETEADMVAMEDHPVKNNPDKTQTRERPKSS